MAHSTTATTASAFVRNDGAVITLAVGTLSAPNVFNNADRVYGVTDDGSTFRSYLDGAVDDTGAYVRSGTMTPDRFSLCAGFTTVAFSFFNTRLYGLVIVKRVIDATERANLVTWLGNKAGLTL